jgi:hypothetical protein
VGVADDRRAGHGVHDALDDRPDLLLRRAAATWRRHGVGGLGEVVQVGALGVAELQHVGQSLSTPSETPEAFPRSRRLS